MNYGMVLFQIHQALWVLFLKKSKNKTGTHRSKHWIWQSHVLVAGSRSNCAQKEVGWFWYRIYCYFSVARFFINFGHDLSSFYTYITYWTLPSPGPKSPIIVGFVNEMIFFRFNEIYQTQGNSLLFNQNWLSWIFGLTYWFIKIMLFPLYTNSGKLSAICQVCTKLMNQIWLDFNLWIQTFFANGKWREGESEMGRIVHIWELVGIQHCFDIPFCI